MLRLGIGDITLAVEHRRAGGDGGATLRVLSTPDERERLRFDCFEQTAHYHVDPGGRDEISSLADEDDPIGWTVGQLSRDWRGWLEKAGLPEPAGVDPERLAAVLREAESALRNPPAMLDKLDVQRLRRRTSEKWSTYPDDILPVWVAEMDFPVAEPIRRVVARAVERSDFGYPVAMRDTGLPEAFCERMRDRFGWSISPSEVEVLSDVVQGMYWACATFAPERPGTVVQTPIYPPFLRVVRDTGRRLVDHRLLPGAERHELDFDALEGPAGSAGSAGSEAMADDVGLLLFCNPHNPSGRVFERAELERLAAWVLERDVLVVSDEIHADLVFDERSHVPFASLSPEIAARTLTLTSASKAFNIPGLRCAVAHFGSPELRRRFRTLPRHLAGGVGLYGPQATIAAWRQSEPWLREVRAYLQANRDYLARELPARFPQIAFRLPEATYLAWLDCSALSLETRPAQHFYAHGRVALSDGAVFGEGYDCHARLNFATSRAILEEALERMERALA